MVSDCDHQEAGQVPGHWNDTGSHRLLRTYYAGGSEGRFYRQPHAAEDTEETGKARGYRAGGRVQV